MEVLTSQKEWPRIGKYIGEVIDLKAYDGENGISYFSTSEVMKSQRNRVYGDEIEVAPRVKDVKYLMACYEDGYHKDIDWFFNGEGIL